MLLFLLLHFLAVRALPIRETQDDEATTSCDNINDSRTLQSIVSSCLTTIFLCTWVSLHPDIPKPIEEKENNIWNKSIRFISGKVVLFLGALLIPDLILNWAVSQRLAAKRIVEDNAQLGVTRTRAFFMIMGGFYSYTGSDRSKISEQVPIRRLTPEEVISLSGAREIFLPRDAEIKDKSKSDWIAKTIVVIQTLWFIIQCIARGHQHLKLTELEVITLSYAVINIGIFLAWWDKPLGVDWPVPVFRRTVTYGHEQPTWFQNIWSAEGRRGPYASPRNVYENYGLNRVGFYGSGKFISMAMAFVAGGIHFAAWNFHFATQRDQSIWHSCSVALVLIPYIIFIFFGILNVGGSFTFILFLVFSVIYGGVRITTVVVAGRSIASSPPEVFQTIHWTTFIPHI